MDFNYFISLLFLSWTANFLLYTFLGGILKIFHKGVRGDDFIRVSFKEK